MCHGPWARAPRREREWREIADADEEPTEDPADDPAEEEVETPEPTLLADD